MSRKLKKITTVRGELYINLDIESDDIGFGDMKLVCRIYRKRKGIFSLIIPYKKLIAYQRSTPNKNLIDISLEEKKEMIKRGIDKYYKEVDIKNQSDSEYENWDGFFDKSLRREKRLGKLLDNDK